MSSIPGLELSGYFQLVWTIAIGVLMAAVFRQNENIVYLLILDVERVLYLVGKSFFAVWSEDGFAQKIYLVD